MEAEFRKLFKDHYSSLCTIAYRVLKESEPARDVVQDVFVELWKTDKWQNMQSPKAYLYVAVHHRAINELKKRKRYSSVEFISLLTPPDETSYDYKELKEALERGVDTLPDQCKKVFLLSREDGLTYIQIAEQLELSVKTVERHMGIALLKMREYLEKFY